MWRASWGCEFASERDSLSGELEDALFGGVEAEGRVVVGAVGAHREALLAAEVEDRDDRVLADRLVLADGQLDVLALDLAVEAVDPPRLGQRARGLAHRARELLVELLAATAPRLGAGEEEASVGPVGIADAEAGLLRVGEVADGQGTVGDLTIDVVELGLALLGVAR